MQQRAVPPGVGADLSNVRVHEGNAPAALGAQAFAGGADIHLGAANAPMIPHEAAHVVQQRAPQALPDADAMQAFSHWAD